MIDKSVALIDPTDPPENEEDYERAILDRAHKDWARASARWNNNRENYREDIRFARLDEQWDKGLARKRLETGRPVLTINKLPPFIRQVVNDARQNKPSIKVLPQDSQADPKTAEIYSGLIRNIESSSDADVAYDTALECAASGGFGFFRVNLAYSDDETFNQDIVFEAIPNPLNVLPDPDSQGADSSDWNICFVADMIPKEAFEAEWPDADPIDFETQNWPTSWREGDRVLVAEYWRREAVQKELILLSDGSTALRETYEAQMAQYVPDGFSPSPPYPVGDSRMVTRHEVVQYLVTGHAVLRETRWAGRQIPIVPVWGEEVNLEGERHFRSLIRGAKDAQVLYNVNRTAAGEAVARAPVAPWLAEEGSIVDPGKWATANSENHAYLEFKAGKTPPQRVGMPQSPVANLQEALTASDEIKAIVGIYDAGIGARSNETSGRAIMARQRESDTSTFHFIDNLSRAIRCAGRIIIDLIPHVYTPGRILRILGEDGTPQIVQSGTQEEMQAAQQAMLEQQQNMQAVYALGTGRYDLTVTVGPAFNTRREEAATQMIELIRAYPAAAPLLGDLLAKNLDWPGADEIEKRLQAAMQQMQEPQAPQQQGPDPAAMAKAETDRFNAQVKAQQGEQKLGIDAFNAETQRLRAAASLQRPTRLPQTPGLSG
jgi:hypothetical protein